MLRRLIVTPLLLICLELSGCFLMYRPDVQQGNVLTPAMVNQLRPGMTVAQVTEIVGTPVLTQMGQDKVVYVYTWDTHRGHFYEKYLKLYFKQGRLERWDTTVTAP
ncbi:MAG TPA: outer membrane protein assembly factor BamE [Coxiellaceae bacterium]|nr:outer membrane protein assembly factor BamE [Coxiellaceae bacterium]